MLVLNSGLSGSVAISTKYELSEMTGNCENNQMMHIAYKELSNNFLITGTVRAAFFSQLGKYSQLTDGTPQYEKHIAVLCYEQAFDALERRGRSLLSTLRAKHKPEACQ